MNADVIKKLLRQRGMMRVTLAKQVGITDTALGYILAGRSTNVNRLEKIAEVLQVSPAIFFDEDPNKYIECQKCAEKDETIRLMKEMLKDKDEMISLLKERMNRQTTGV